METNKAVDFYKKVENVPGWAQKTIGAGRLKGMTDINPQWRIKCLVDEFGYCGVGWMYLIKRLWTEKAETETLAFAEIELKIKINDAWGESIPGIGGSKMVTKEKEGLHVSDECYKMAVTDALSVACKMLGIGAAVYSGSKYDTFVKSENEKTLNEKALATAIEKMAEQKTKEGITEIWNKFVSFQKDPSFIKITKEVGTKLNNL